MVGTKRVPWDSIGYCMCPSRPKYTIVSVGFCKAHMRVHVSKLSVPSQMYLNLMGFFKDLHMHVYTCVQAVGPIPNVPQRILWDSVRTCICMYIHVFKLSVPSQVYCGTSKNPMGFCKAHMHVHVSKLSVPSQNTSKNL